jgi:hypothetical protein
MPFQVDLCRRETGCQAALIGRLEDAALTIGGRYVPILLKNSAIKWTIPSL